MKNKLKLSFSFLVMAAMLCACSNSNNNNEPENTSQAEISTSETASESKDSAFVKDGIMYIRESNGNCYTYNDGIYTDDVTNESYIYSYSYFNLYAVDPDADIFKSVDSEDYLSEIGNMDDENTEGKGVKIELSKMKSDPATDRYYFEEDMIGRKSYYPENGIWSTDGEFYVFSKNGTRITFKNLEEITE